MYLIKNKSSRKLNLPQNIILEVDYTTVSFYENKENTINSNINPSAIRLDGSVTKFDNWKLHTEKID